jgi:dolichol-phosphate mannosyltransferase
MPPSPTYSVIVPIFNEEETLPELYRRMSAVLDGLDGPSELILVDDGSRDRSLELMRDLSRRDPRVRILSFSRNFGHQMAITAGIDYAGGAAVVVIDADLQDPPEAIPSLIAAWKNGAELVYAVRTERKGETFFKRLSASMFYRLIASMTDLKIPLD